MLPLESPPLPPASSSAPVSPGPPPPAPPPPAYVVSAIAGLVEASSKREIAGAVTATFAAVLMTSRLFFSAINSPQLHSSYLRDKKDGLPEASFPAAAINFAGTVR